MIQPQIHHRIQLLACLFLALTVNPSSSFGNKIRQRDALIVTTAYQMYDFVMMPSQPPPPKSKSAVPLPEGKAGERRIIDPNVYDFYATERAIIGKYRASGLYPHGSIVPIWTVDWHDVNVVVSGDGHHLARMHWNYDDDLNHPEITLYEDGKELRMWSMKDLVNNNVWCLLKSGLYLGLELKRHIEPGENRTGAFDEVDFVTTRGQSLRFNLATGELVERTINQCELRLPYLFDMRWDAPHVNPLQEIGLNDDHPSNQWLLLTLGVGVFVILFQSRKNHRKHQKTKE